MSDDSLIPNFHAATQPKQLTSHTYLTHFHPDWCIGSVPHGGYVTSAIQRAATLHLQSTHSSRQQPNLLTLHLEFLRRTSVGPALITLHDSKIGRSTSTIHATLTQPEVDANRGDEVVGYLTYTNFSSQLGPTFDTRWALHPPAPPLAGGVRALESGHGNDNWISVAELPFSDFRKASRRCSWFLPRKGRARITTGGADQWFALNTHNADGSRERWTDDSVGLVCDMFPQVVETFLIPDVYTPLSSSDTKDAGKTKSPAARFWYPTLLLNMEVKKSLGSEGVRWLFLRVVTKKVEKGRYDLDVVVLDERGELVALSNHVCFALPAARNLGKRSGGKARL